LLLLRTYFPIIGQIVDVTAEIMEQKGILPAFPRKQEQSQDEIRASPSVSGDEAVMPGFRV
jgi:hypothetical protein